VDGDWDGRWTVVAFSLPDDARRQRHALRSRLAWAGFGMVQAGVWAAPRDVDVVALLADLEVLAHVTAFRGQPLPPTDGGALLRASFDLDALAARYEAFDSRWVTLRSVAPEDLVDPLTARVLLSADWLQVLRDDPRLPQEFLPPTWPATAARDLHHALESQWRRPAEREARRRLQIVRVDSAASTGEG
jgi:phenylacetic acid degradation operon negative regulatory protein